MHVRFPLPIALVVALAGLTGCNGGGSSTANAAPASCAGTAVNALCLTSCSLGCSGTRCEITEIAQNQNIVLVFSRDVDPSTVNESTIRFRTASGEKPEGNFFTNGNVVEFQPSVLVVGGSSYFGFRAGETYTMTLPGGSGQVNSVRSTSGDPLLASITCSLNVTLGIVDLNRLPPSAELVSPPTPASGPIVNVPKDVVIQLRFNELIDVTPFQGTNAANGPVVFAVRGTRLVGTARECDPNFGAVPLTGTPRIDTFNYNGSSVSVVSLRPTQLLPGNICVDVTVTDRVRDLSGRPSQPRTYQFQTVTEPQVEHEIAEEFTSTDRFDRDSSSGTWGNGVATFGSIGGDGRHGPFTLDEYVANHSVTDNGIVNGKHEYVINTDQLIIPGGNTLSGNAVAVTNGEYFFSSMTVPSDTRLVFSGSHPPVFHVRGKLEVAGNIELRGGDTTYYAPTSTTTVGQTGGAGAVYAGAGGRGGNKCLGNGFSSAYNGQNGEDCRVALGHAYAGSVVGTGGRGSALFPGTGLNSSVVFGTGTSPIKYAIMAAAGGSGGGLWAAGGRGRVVYNNINDPVAGVPPRLDFMGPPADGGLAMQLLPLPVGAKSSLHFLVGGSGGGGGGSHALFQNNFLLATAAWTAGCGGGGGAGALALIAGDNLVVPQNAQILLRGGAAGRNESTIVVGTVQSAPAGGGSGGSVVLQSGRAADVVGLIDVRGGQGGYLNRQTSVAPPDGGRVEIAGGDGAPGYIRLEVPSTSNPGPSLLPNVQPSATSDNVAVLVEQDDVVGLMSGSYSTQQPIPPEFARYVIEARVNGQLVKFSDDPAEPNSLGAAKFGTAPIQAYFQSVRIDLGTGQPIAGTYLPWGENVGFFNNTSGLSENGYRFCILFDRRVAPTVEIEKVSVFYRL